MFVDGKWKAERLLLSTDPSHTAEDVIMTYSLRWTIEPMFAALKWGEGMIDMWMVETFHRWLTIVQIGRALRLCNLKSGNSVGGTAKLRLLGIPCSWSSIHSGGPIAPQEI